MVFVKDNGIYPIENFKKIELERVFIDCTWRDKYYIWNIRGYFLGCEDVKTFATFYNGDKAKETFNDIIQKIESNSPVYIFDSEKQYSEVIQNALEKSKKYDTGKAIDRICENLREMYGISSNVEGKE